MYLLAFGEEPGNASWPLMPSPNLSFHSKRHSRGSRWNLIMPVMIEMLAGVSGAVTAMEERCHSGQPLSALQLHLVSDYYCALIIGLCLVGPRTGRSDLGAL